eukprot:8888802-Karenia_brevis.AAC.1
MRRSGMRWWRPSISTNPYVTAMLVTGSRQNGFVDSVALNVLLLLLLARLYSLIDELSMAFG